MTYLNPKPTNLPTIIILSPKFYQPTLPLDLNITFRGLDAIPKKKRKKNGPISIKQCWPFIE
jgi:hypothetical protein